MLFNDFNVGKCGPKALFCAAVLLCLGAAPALADSLKLTETRLDKSVCDPDYGCSVSTAGRYTVSLTLSPATIGSASAFGDFPTLLDDAFQNGTLPVSLSIGDFYFDGDVIDDLNSTLTATSVRATWVNPEDVCVDADCINTKTVQTERLVLTGNLAKGVTLNLSGSNLENDFNSYGQSPFQALCTDNGIQTTTVSVIIGDAEITKDIVVNCKVITKQDADLNDLLNQKITAKLAAPSCSAN